MVCLYSLHDIYKERICGLCGKCLKLENRGASTESSFDRFVVQNGAASCVYNDKSTVVADRIEKNYGQPYPKNPRFPPNICSSCRSLLYKIEVEGKDFQVPYEIPFDTVFEPKHLNVAVEKINDLTEEQFKTLEDCPTCSKKDHVKFKSKFCIAEFIYFKIISRAFQAGKLRIMSQVKNTQRVDNGEKRCNKTNRNGEICGQIIRPGISHKCGDALESHRQLLEMLGPRQRQQIASRTIKDILDEESESDSENGARKPPLKSARLSTFGAPLTVCKTTDALNYQAENKYSNDEIIRYWRDKNMSRQESRDSISFLNADKQKKTYQYTKIEKELNDRVPTDFYASKLVWLDSTLEYGEKHAYPENLKADETCKTCMGTLFLNLKVIK